MKPVYLLNSVLWTLLCGSVVLAESQPTDSTSIATEIDSFPSSVLLKWDFK